MNRVLTPHRHTIDAWRALRDTSVQTLRLAPVCVTMVITAQTEPKHALNARRVRSAHLRTRCHSHATRARIASGEIRNRIKLSGAHVVATTDLDLREERFDAWFRKFFPRCSPS